MKIIIVYIVITFFSLFTRGKVFEYLSVVLLSFFFASRSLFVPDAAAYQDFYLTNISEGSSIEYGYMYLCYIFHSILGVSFRVYLFILSLFLLMCWRFSINRLFPKVPFQFFLISFLPFFGFYYYGAVLRASIAITISMVGMSFLFKDNSSKRIIIYLLCVLLAMQFHVTAILFFFVFLALPEYKNHTLYILIALSVFFITRGNLPLVDAYLAGVVEYFSFDRLSPYFMRYTQVNTSILSITYIIISFVAVYYRKHLTFYTIDEKRLFNIILNMHVLATLLNSMVDKVQAATRLPMQWLFFEFVVVTLLCLRHPYMKANSSLRNIVFLFYSFVMFFAFIHYFPLFLKY